MRSDLALPHQAVDVEAFLNLEIEAGLPRPWRAGRHETQQPRANDDGRDRLHRGPCVHAPLSCAETIQNGAGFGHNRPMPSDHRRQLSRREFARLAAATAVAAGARPLVADAVRGAAPAALAEFGYGDVTVDSRPAPGPAAEHPRGAHGAERGQPAEAVSADGGAARAGRLTSAAGTTTIRITTGARTMRDSRRVQPSASGSRRWPAITRSADRSRRATKCCASIGSTASPSAADFYDKNRFPAYCYDKLVLGLIDSHQFAGDRQALALLDRTTAAAVPHLPRARGRSRTGVATRQGSIVSLGRVVHQSRESVSRLPARRRAALSRAGGAVPRRRDLVRSAGARRECARRQARLQLRELAELGDAGLPHARQRQASARRHAMRSPCWRRRVTRPAAGGRTRSWWRRTAASSDASLTATHNSFETPCGAYAHFKLTRYLLRVTRDARYGDSMERVMYNTVLGAKPLRADGRAFYYADYNLRGPQGLLEPPLPLLLGHVAAGRGGLRHQHLLA